MKDSKLDRIRRWVWMLRQQFLQSGSGVFDQALGEQELVALMSELLSPYRERIYPPLDTLRLFVGQALSADRACQDVVSCRLSERIAQGQSSNALNTGSYCDARSRLPTALPTTLGATLGERLESAAPSHWRWRNRSETESFSEFDPFAIGIAEFSHRARASAKLFAEARFRPGVGV